MSKTTLTTTRGLRAFALLVFSILCPLLWAQNTGTVVGRVTDASTRLALSGARVGIAGTSLETFTTQAGDYVILNVPAGAQVVEVNYVGYPMITAPVTVAANQTAKYDAVFGAESTVELEKLVITGSKVGTARAINQQRAAATFTNIVAADDIGRFPDQNAAESLQRIPGLAIYRDQGEGRFLVVRGTAPDLNSVTLNGMGVASPERASRTLALDVIPSDSLGTVEVTKVTTPDLPAEGLGGAINMKTRSAFDSQEREFNLNIQGQYNRLRDKYGKKVNGTYTDLFLGGKLGVMIAGTYQEREIGSNNFEEDGGWLSATATSGATALLFQGLAHRQYEIERKRIGFSSSIEFKPDAETYIYFRTTWSHFDDSEKRYITMIPFEQRQTLTQIDAISATTVGVRRERHEFRARDKNQNLAANVVGIEKTLGNWQLGAKIGYSYGGEDWPNQLEARIRKSTRGTNWYYTFADGTYAPSVVQTAGPNLADPANAGLFNEISRLRIVDRYGSETEWDYGADAKYSFTAFGKDPAYVKVGASRREKNKKQRNETNDYQAQTGGTLTFLNSVFNYASLYELQPNYPFYGGTRFNATATKAAFAANQAALPPLRLPDSVTADWTSTEDVTAGYAMAGITINKLNLIAGARYEKTEFASNGFDAAVLASGGVGAATAISAAKDYDNVLPGVYGRYDLTKQVTLRASYSTALSRPRFQDSARSRSVNATAGSELVVAGNPALDPLESQNLDASIEYYLSSLGLISVGVFQKKIDHFTYQTTTGIDPATGFPLSTFLNGNDGTITGVELAYQQQFKMLPAPFDGLGVIANYTMSDSEATYPTRPGETLDFIGQSKHIGNLALTYEKYRLFLRVAANFRSPRMREDELVGTTAATDRWVDDFMQVDATASFKLNSHWEIFAEALNLTDEPFRVYFAKNGTRLTQFEEYGITANCGVRWKL